MKQKRRTISFSTQRNELCPCGSSKRLDACHSLTGSFPVSICKPPLPLQSTTSYSNNACYLKDTCDCDSKITREHPISESILKQIPFPNITGGPGNLDRLPFFPINALASKVLCERHNALLSDLDTQAGLAFSTLVRAVAHVMEPEGNRRKERIFIVDGLAIELWSLKLLLGGHFGKLLRHNDASTLDMFNIDIMEAIYYLQTGIMEAPCGIYCQSFGSSSDMSVAPIIHGDRLDGIYIQLMHLNYWCITSKQGGEANLDTDDYRPSIIELRKNDFCSLIYMAWQRPPQRGSVVKTYDLTDLKFEKVPLF